MNRNSAGKLQVHMFPLPCLEREAPVLRRTAAVLPILPEISRFEMIMAWMSNIYYLWIFQVDHTFYKLDLKIWAANNEIRCVHCSYPPSSSSALDERFR